MQSFLKVLNLTECENHEKGEFHKNQFLVVSFALFASFALSISPKT